MKTELPAVIASYLVAGKIKECLNVCVEGWQIGPSPCCECIEADDTTLAHIKVFALKYF